MDVSGPCYVFRLSGKSQKGKAPHAFAFWVEGAKMVQEYRQSPYLQMTHLVYDPQKQNEARVASAVMASRPAGLQSYHAIDFFSQLMPELPAPEQQYFASQENTKVLGTLRARMVGSFGAEELIWRDRHPRVQVLALDHLQDPRNVGALIRSAAFLGVKYVMMPRDRQVGLTGAVVHCSRGGLGHVQVVEVRNLARALELVKKHGYWVIGADMDGEDVAEVGGMYEKSVLVLGHEGSGLSPLMRRKCDRIVKVSGAHISSLNVSVAGGILMRDLGKPSKK